MGAIPPRTGCLTPLALMRWLRDPELGAVSGCPWRRPAEPSRVARDGLRASQRRRLGRDRLPSLRPLTGEACKSDREIVLKAEGKMPSCLWYAGEACKNDREFVLKAVEKEPSLPEVATETDDPMALRRKLHIMNGRLAHLTQRIQTSDKNHTDELDVAALTTHPLNTFEPEDVHI